jgi:mannosyltransferase
MLAPPLVLLVLSYVVTPSFVPRYFLIAIPGLALFAARGLATTRPSLVAGLALALILVIPAATSLRSQPSQAQDYRAAAAYVLANQRDGDAILFDHPAHRDGLEYYFRAREGPKDALFLEPGASRGRLYAGEVYPATDQHLADFQRVWTVEGRRLYRHEEFLGLTKGFELVDSLDLYGLTLSLYQRTQ